jgi:hypothetical protein
MRAVRGGIRSGLGVLLGLALLGAVPALAADVDRLVAAFAGETPLLEDLRSLTDEVGGRPTGSAANRRGVEWALNRFRGAGVEARREEFTLPALWLERSARASVKGVATFSPQVAAMPFSTPTPPAGLEAPLLDGGGGSAKDFERLGSKARGAFVLVETPELLDLDGLFREYTEAAAIEKRAFPAGVGGLVYMASRPRTLLYRHNASLAEKNRHPMLVMEREGAERALRLLRAGQALSLWAQIDIESGGPYPSHNVVAEIAGTERPSEIVLLGAHLDSWDLGTGALDNGCNAALVVDMARQIRALGLKPRRTLRFVLWNGEEQMMHGSWGYTKTHAAELERHVVTVTLDIGSGRINGFFTNGRAELLPAVEGALAPVRGLGPFTQVEEPIVGTDNYDFMLQGVANLVASQESANYGPNYHARSDTFDKVDQRQLRLNAAVTAAVVWGIAQGEVTWARQSRAEVEALVQKTTLKDQMASFGLLESWQDGTRGRKP